MSGAGSVALNMANCGEAVRYRQRFEFHIYKRAVHVGLSSRKHVLA
jgi:hypothetical protein